jgi:hypothetical protein
MTSAYPDANYPICSTLAKVRAKIVAIQEKHLYERLWCFFKDPEKINDMKEDLDVALRLFKVRNIHLF